MWNFDLFHYLCADHSLTGLILEPAEHFTILGRLGTDPLLVGQSDLFCVHLQQTVA